MLLSVGRSAHAVAADGNREAKQVVVCAFNFQNAYGIDRWAPRPAQNQDELDGHALMLPVDLKLGQYMQAQ